MKDAINPYIEYNKSSDIHGTALYPAVMVAPVQRDLLKEILPEKEAITVFDPFVGSGTAVYEAARLRPDARIVGSDINPLAILITRVKLEGVDSLRIEEDIASLEKMLMREQLQVNVPQFYNIDKWFKVPVQHSLAWICDAVNRIECEKNRRFFWYMLIDVVRKYCNSRSSTYKLHLRTEEQVKRIGNNVVQDYMAKVKEEWRFFEEVQCDCAELNQGDTIEYLKTLKENCVDICITSPPYGDNATTVPYGQYSTLAMSWISSEDLNLEGWELDTYASIDSRSLGGCSSPASNDFLGILDDEEILKNIDSINPKKRAKVTRFFSGYTAFLEEMIRITSYKAVLTLGNRTVDGINIDLAGYTERYLKRKGLGVSERMRRPIARKRTPSKVSRVKGSPVNSMKEERVIVVDMW